MTFGCCLALSFEAAKVIISLQIRNSFTQTDNKGYAEQERDLGDNGGRINSN
jgi:hypothetical protein